MRHIFSILGMIAIAFGFYSLMLYLERDSVLYSMIVPDTNLRLGNWLQVFSEQAMLGIFGSLIAAILWYVLGAFVFRINSLQQAQRIHYWFLFLLIPIGLTVYNSYFMSPAKENSWLAYLFYFANNLLTYYLATVLFSPSSFKYTPPLATVLRRF
jgi:hypothetical protein